MYTVLWKGSVLGFLDFLKHYTDSIFSIIELSVRLVLSQSDIVVRKS